METPKDFTAIKPPLVSIIVPVYNVESYITDCLESILIQDYPAIEIILINDKTPDNSMLIAQPVIEKLKKKYSVSIINHDVNRGLSVARNSGTKAAKGDYVYFIDSDDKIKSYAISSLVELVRNNKTPDMVIGNYIVSDSDQPEPIPVSGLFNDKNSIIKIFLESNLQIMPWNKLIRRSFLVENNIFFEEGLLNEDVLFSYQTALKAHRIFITNKATYIYNYGVRTDSICINYTYKHMMAFLYITRKKIELFDNESLYKYFYGHIVKYCYHLLGITYHYNIEKKMYIIGEIKDIISSLRPARTQTKKMFLKKIILSSPSIMIHLFFSLERIRKEGPESR
jgi:glycosyltransferase involved in cell wall biosynthesis